MNRSLKDRGLIIQQPYTPEDNGSDDYQVEDESGSIVGLSGRTYIILVAGSVADKRASPIDLRITTAGDHRGAGYSLSALIVIPAIS